MATKERSIDHHSRIMTGCLREKKESNLVTKKRAFTIQSVVQSVVKVTIDGQLKF